MRAKGDFVSENMAYEADREGLKDLRRTSTASDREERYGEDAPTDSELEDE